MLVRITIPETRQILSLEALVLKVGPSLTSSKGSIPTDGLLEISFINDNSTAEARKVMAGLTATLKRPMLSVKPTVRSNLGEN